MSHFDAPHERQRELHIKEVEQSIFSNIFIDAVSVRCVPNKPCVVYEGRLYHTEPQVEAAVLRLRQQAGDEIQLDLRPSEKGVRVLYQPTGSGDAVNYLDGIHDTDVAGWIDTARSIAQRHPEWVPPVDPKVLAKQKAREKAKAKAAADKRRDIAILEKEKLHRMERKQEETQENKWDTDAAAVIKKLDTATSVDANTESASDVSTSSSCESPPKTHEPQQEEALSLQLDGLNIARPQHTKKMKKQGQKLALTTSEHPPSL